jgi:hypothetical protein
MTTFSAAHGAPQLPSTLTGIIATAYSYWDNITAAAGYIRDKLVVALEKSLEAFKYA